MQQLPNAENHGIDATCAGEFEYTVVWFTRATETQSQTQAHWSTSKHTNLVPRVSLLCLPGNEVGKHTCELPWRKRNRKRKHRRKKWKNFHLLVLAFAFHTCEPRQRKRNEKNTCSMPPRLKLKSRWSPCSPTKRQRQLSAERKE